MATNYTYSDKYGINHTVSDYNTAKQYSANGAISTTGGTGLPTYKASNNSNPSSSSSSNNGGITQNSNGWNYNGKTYGNLSDALGAAGAAGYGSTPNNNTYGSSTTQWTNYSSGTPQYYTGYSNANGQQTSSTPAQPAYQAPVVQQPIGVQIPQIPAFTPPAQNAMSFDQAKSQVQQQLDPLYQKAAENIQKQRYQNELNAGELAKNKGLAHSGLAADLQNKVGIQAQQDLSNSELDKTAKIAAMAQALQQQDVNNYQNTYQNALNTWLNNSNMAINQYKLQNEISQWQQQYKAQQEQADWMRKLGLYTLMNRVWE